MKRMRGGLFDWMRSSKSKIKVIEDTSTPIVENSKQEEFEENDKYSEYCNYKRDIKLDNKKRETDEKEDLHTTLGTESYMDEDGEQKERKIDEKEDCREAIHQAIEDRLNKEDLTQEDIEESEKINTGYNKQRDKSYFRNKFIYQPAKKVGKFIYNIPGRYVVQPGKKAVNFIGKTVKNTIQRPQNSYPIDTPPQQQQTKKSSWWPFRRGGKSRKRLKRKLKERRRKSRKVFKRK